MVIGYGEYEVALMEDREEQRLIDQMEYLLWEAQMAANDKFNVEQSDWEAVLSEFESKEGGMYLFPEVGTTRVRILVSPEREPTQFWQPVVTTYAEKARTRHMIPLLVADAQGTFQYEVKYAVVAKTVLKDILSILAAGEYDLLHPEKGHGVSIIRTGEGLGTRYSVMPSKNQIPIDYNAIEFPAALEDVAREFVKSTEEPKEDNESWSEVPF